MEPIRFYQIPFSHFCDKVRWALDFYSLKYQSINYSRQRPEGLQRAPKDLQKLVPIIEDPNEQSKFISDSTPILLYLEDHYAKDRHLFPEENSKEKEEIVEYCLKLDSSLGLYARRLAYLKIISQKPSLLSVLVDGNYGRTDFDTIQSSVLGLMGALIVMGRFAIDRIDQDNTFLQTIEVLDQIEKDLQGKEFLFSNQFTAADLTLTSLIYPLRLCPSLVQRYSSIFEYSERIRSQFDPKPPKPSAIEFHLLNQSSSFQISSLFKTILFYFFYCILYPLKIFLVNSDQTSLNIQYPSTNIKDKAQNDNRILKLNSTPNLITFFCQSILRYFYTLPKQIRAINQQSQQIFHQDF